MAYFGIVRKKKDKWKDIVKKEKSFTIGMDRE